MTCDVDGCEKPARTRGWCSAHYERWRRNGDSGKAGDARSRPSLECSVEGCELWARARGWCDKHYACWHLTGDPIPRKRPNYGSKRVVAPNGYVKIWEPDHQLAHADGYVYEHRKVAWDAGLLTDPSMLVHHLDENKSNNCLSNLEVKTHSDHRKDHLREAGSVSNQYGTWPLRG